MRLLLFRSLWTTGFDLETALADCRCGLFDGIEGPLPEDTAAKKLFAERLRAEKTPFIAELTTGGGYVPRDRSPQRHLEEFRRKLDEAVSCSPRLITALAGCDSWPLAQSVDFLGSALAIARELGATVSFETHRSRPTFNPWTTAQLLRQLPKLRLTCDFSHWCCVCERFVLDEEAALLDVIADRAAHVHARVGYDQGPQVPHPAAPEYADALAAHERWWDVLWAAQAAEGADGFTMTPEFGPDGYLQAAPFTRTPVASLDEINRWMAKRQRERFAARQTKGAAV